MGIRGLAKLATLAFALLVAGCGGGSGRQGTDIVVTGSGPTATLAAGDTAVFTMTVSNAGDNDASDVTVGNHASGLTVSGITCAASGGATCPASTSGTMSVPSLPAGGKLTFQVTTTVAQLGSGEVTVQNTMSAAYGSDVDSSNNSASIDATAYLANAAVSVTGTNPTGVVAAGSTAEFVFTVHNDGPDAAEQVNLTASLNNSSHTTIACTASSGATCPSPLVSPMSIDALPSGATLTFTIDATVSPSFNGTVQATLRESASTYDPDQSDGSLTLQAQASTATDLTVTQSVPATTAAGGTAQFQVVVSNPGSSTVSNVVVTDTLTSGFSVTVTCTANGGMACPATDPASPISIPTLRGGDFLTLTYNVPVPADSRSAITNTVEVSSADDPDASNNKAVASTQVVNGLNGSYTVFAADGRQYALTIDFDQASYTMSGNGHTWNESFSADSTTGDFVVTGNSLERLRTATDLIVGGHDFGTGEGVLPYVAARSFVTSQFQAQGSYDLATRNLAAGSATTHAGTANISNNTLTVCQTDADVARTSACSSTPVSYSLSLSGNVFKGVNTLDASDVFSFMVARSGALTLLVSAGEASDGSQQLRIGIPDSSSIAGGSALIGPSTLGSTGDWVTIDLSQTNYQFTSLLSNTDSATLDGISAGGPFAIRSGNRTSDGALIYVMQGVPVEVTVGDFSGAANGLLQITLP